MSSRPTAVASLLRDHTKELTARAAHHDLARRQLRELLPEELVDHLRGVVVDGDGLTVFVDTPTWITRFRFLVPSLLRQTSLPSGRCRFRVLPDPGPPDSEPVDARCPVSSQAIALLRSLANDCPSPQLAISLQRLADALARRQTA